MLGGYSRQWPRSRLAGLAVGLGLGTLTRFVFRRRYPGNVEQWVAWVNGDLLSAALAHTAVGPREISGVIDERIGDGYGVRFAWHTGVGYFVQPEGPLNVPNPAPAGQPYFALDTDSYWLADTSGHVLTVDAADLAARIQRLHDPVQERFESSIEDKLRDEVLIPREQTS